MKKAKMADPFFILSNFNSLFMMTAIGVMRF